MILSHSKKFIFIHIYKVAGTSLSNVLSRYNTMSIFMFRPYRFISRTMPNMFPNPYHRHISASELKLNLTPQVFNDYFKFAFVRNPWDWQVSLYKYAMKKRNHHQRKKVLSLGNFESYLKWATRDINNITLQRDFIYEKDTNMMNFVGKFENLQNDYDIICEQIGLKKSKLKHLNKTNRKDYREYYTPETKDLVFKYYKKDIELFEYDF